MVTAAIRSSVVFVLISLFTGIGLSQTKSERIDAFMQKLAEKGLEFTRSR